MLRFSGNKPFSFHCATGFWARRLPHQLPHLKQTTGGEKKRRKKEELAAAKPKEGHLYQHGRRARRARQLRPVAAVVSCPPAAGTPGGAAPPRGTPGSAAPRSERAAGQRPPPCSGRQRGTADGVRLGWLRVRGAGRLRGHHRLRQGR